MSPLLPPVPRVEHVCEPPTTCHAVWVVRAPDQPGRWQPHVGYRPSARRWAVASMRKAREHHARAGTFVGSDCPPSPPRWPRWIAWPWWLLTAAAAQDLFEAGIHGEDHESGADCLINLWDADWPDIRLMGPLWSEDDHGDTRVEVGDV